MPMGSTRQHKGAGRNGGSKECNSHSPQNSNETGMAKTRKGLDQNKLDASWCRETKIGGIGVIARDEEGRMIGGANRRTTGWNIESLEVEAILLGGLLAMENSWGRLIIEFDSEKIMNQVKGTTYS